MKVTGIIAEYNPFHKGHKYQIDTLRAQYQPDYVMVAMSGDFLQRGTPALLNKYTRAQMALSHGADLVFELPSCFATSSAENFAKGGILLFESTGITDSLCFGAESSDLDQMQTLADLLITEPDWYKNTLLSYLKEGFSFPAARTKALPEYAHLLETPNNILAIEYLKALKFYHSNITPISIQRKGSGYHDTAIHVPLASASAIRNAIRENASLANTSKISYGKNTGSESVDVSAANILPSELKEALPDTSYTLMQNYQQEASFLWENDFSILLHHALLKEHGNSLLSYADMTPTLSNRILKQRNSFLSWSDFCSKCSTKDTTYARMSRILTHILLNIRKEHLAPYTHPFQTKNHASFTPDNRILSDIKQESFLSDTSILPNTGNTVLPYLRILGFRQSAVPLLTALKASAKAPILTSPTAADKLLSQEGLAMLQTDLFASDLYRSVLTQKSQRIYPNEFRRKLLVMKDIE